MMRSSLVAPIAVLATAAAWLSFPSGESWVLQDERAWVIGCACAAGCALGAVLDSPRIRSSRWMSVLCAAVLCPLLSLGTTGVASLPFFLVRAIDHHASFCLGLALAPAVALVVLTRPQRFARAGSVLWDTDVRSTWAVVGALVALGALAKFASSLTVPMSSWVDHDGFFVRAELANQPTLCLGAVSSIAVAWTFIENLRTRRGIRRLAIDMASMDPCEGYVLAPSRNIDLGVGDEQVGRPVKSAGSAYRAPVVLEPLVRGSMGEASCLLRRGLWITAACFTVVVVASAIEVVAFFIVGERCVT